MDGSCGGWILSNYFDWAMSSGVVGLDCHCWPTANRAFGWFLLSQLFFFLPPFCMGILYVKNSGNSVQLQQN